MDFSIFKQTWQMIRQNRIFTGIYILGTAFAVAMITGYAISYYMRIMPIYPEYQRPYTVVLNDVTLKKGSSSYSHALGLGAIKRLRELENVELLTAIYKSMPQRDEVVSMDNTYRTFINRKLVDTEFFRFFTFDFIEGSPFTQAQFDGAERVAIITDNFSKEMFGSPKQAMGQEFYLNYIPYRVIGVVKSPSTISTESFAHAYMPYTSESGWDETELNNWFGGYKAMIVTKDNQALKKEIFDMVRRENSTHSSDDYEIRILTRCLTTLQRVLYEGVREDGTFSWWTLTKTLGWIVLVLLLVPALNLAGLISSRMDNRLAEMGLRKSFGATSGQLLMRIMCENLILTCLGGLLGLILCWTTLYFAGEWIFKAMGVISTFVGNVGKSEDTIILPSMLFTPVVFLSAFFICLFLNITSALIPAWRSLRRPIVNSLKDKI